MSNHLKDETSPYLLQHAENPVDWYPWGSAAFEKAKKEDKPVFLSIGYSTCHWCHVMAHESFEDGKTAGILNKYFVSIKVDREERPDIDSVYMSVCQAFTGSGGWPMSIFMTWDKKPFFVGTYFPVHSRYGMPGFPDLLDKVAERWRKDREGLMRSADQIIAHLQRSGSGSRDAGDEDLPGKAVRIFAENFDSICGGFGDAPKFPVPHNLLFLMLYAEKNKDFGTSRESFTDKSRDPLHMVEKTLMQMRKGGIFDHIGYGFSRYSTDQYFLAPHFEKMLYDNALMIMAYASAYQMTRTSFYLDTAGKTAQYVLREMTSLDGGFYSAQDADSEGIEGKYYTFTLEEIIALLGKERGTWFADTFDITAEGNFEGFNIPNLLKSNALNADFDKDIQKLYDYRRGRTRLHLDDKILLSWNSLMIAAMSMLYRVSHEEKYLQAARSAQIFIEKKMSRGLCLFTSWRDGKVSENSFLDDYAFYIAALTELYHSTLDINYLTKAERFCREALSRFADDENGGFFLSDRNSTELFMNPKESYDGAVPSGNSVMAYNLVRLYQLTQKEKYRELAVRQLQYMSSQAREYPAGYSMFLLAKLLYEDPPEQIVVVLKQDSDLESIKKQLPLLANVTMASESREYPLLNDSTTFYVCKGHTCLAPANSLGNV